MNNYLARVHHVAQRFLPPAVWRRLRRLVPTHGYSGNYTSWEAARAASRGYDSAEILRRARAAALKVKNGQAWAERDSVILSRGAYPFQVLAALLRSALENEGRLHVLDFGGSLASTYYQCRDFLTPIHDLQWSVVEQRDFVDFGQREFSDGSVSFFLDVDAALEVRRPQVLLLASVLPYLAEPYTFLEDMLRRNFSAIVVDRTFFSWPPARDRITVQTVQPEIYEGSYPAWILSRERFLALMLRHYDLLSEFEALTDNMFDDAGARCLGYIFTRRSSTLEAAR